MEKVTKPKENKMEKLNVYGKLAQARVDLQKKDLTKSGLNKFAGFKYYELSDFLPHINNIFNELGLVSQFILTENTGELTIFDTTSEGSITFTTPTEELVQKGMQPIQALGSKHTYLKRYLYLNALEIVESDIVDASDSKQSHTQENKQALDKINKENAKGSITQEQVIKIKGSMPEERIAGMLKFFKVDKVEELSLAQAENTLSKLVNEEPTTVKQIKIDNV